MKMRLKFSNLIVLTSICWALSACSTHRAKVPAPVYGATNPYEDRREVVTHPIPPASSTQVDDSQISEYSVFRENSQSNPMLSPAVLALVQQADSYSKAGDAEAAASKIQRALRIDSRNPILLYKLAMLRFQQSKPHQTENLAKKAALLSAHDRRLKRQCWLLVSEARKQQKNYHGAKEALMKANKL